MAQRDLVKELLTDKEFRRHFMEHQLVNRVAAHLHSTLHQRGITAAELSERCGIEETLIADLLAGVSPMNLSVLLEVATELEYLIEIDFI